MSHTPGPCDCYVNVLGEVVHCPLHAAAPDLLEALQYCTRLLEGRGHGGLAGTILGKAAIAKATKVTK